VERVFVWLWLNFCCQRRIKPFSPALFLLCSALSRLSSLLPLWDPWAAFHCVLNEGGSNIITHLFALALGLSPALEELLMFAWGLTFICLRQSFPLLFAFARLCSPSIPTRIRLFPYSVLVCRQDFIFWFVMSLSQFMSCPFAGGVFGFFFFSDGISVLESLCRKDFS